MTQTDLVKRLKEKTITVAVNDGGGEVWHEQHPAPLEQEAAAEIERLQGLVYAPGRWRCAKCQFTLLQSNLNAGDGSVTARDTPGDTCPNCASPLWRVSWKQEAEENLTIAERLFDEKQGLVKDNDRVWNEALEARGWVKK